MAVENVITNGVGGSSGSIVGAGASGFFVVSGIWDGAKVQTKVTVTGFPNKIEDETFTEDQVKPLLVLSDMTVEVEVVGGGASTDLSVGFVT